MGIGFWLGLGNGLGFRRLLFLFWLGLYCLLCLLYFLRNIGRFLGLNLLLSFPPTSININIDMLYLLNLINIDILNDNLILPRRFSLLLYIQICICIGNWFRRNHLFLLNRSLLLGWLFGERLSGLGLGFGLCRLDWLFLLYCFL